MISIIIPVLNEEKNIGKLLSHLKKSSAGFITEIIVADGGSTDRTIDVTREMGATPLICKNKGRGVQMNEGASNAKGKILYFLHADTLPPDRYDQHIVEAYKHGYKSGCFRLRFDDPHWTLRIYSWFTRFETTFFRFGDQSLFAEKTLFYKIGGFDESLLVMEDQDMVRRLKKVGAFELIEENVITSSRKYRENGFVRLQLVFSIILLMYYAGANQNTLVHFYISFIKNLGR